MAASLVTVLLLAACAAAPSVPSSGSPIPVPPSAPTVSDPPDASAAPSPSAPAQPASPAPSARPTPATSVVWKVEETYLRAGILRGAIDCVPVRTGLPQGATGGIECGSDDPRVARLGFYIFDGDGEMLDAYYARMKAEGVALDSGSCAEGEGEGAYVPGEDEIASRVGCFVNAEGYANYRITMPGDRVYIGILGRTANPVDLENFAWLGNQDVPGNPTLWGEAAVGG